MGKEYLKMADGFKGGAKWFGDALREEAGAADELINSAVHAIDSHDELVAEVERLRELERDAMRYRFLRECHWSESPLCVVVNPKQMVKLGSDCPATTRLDDAIDEAMV